ncbi:hypothetical protein [Halomonas llamarensis]|uniref:Uncharacterized protein n=1 Tax=Halomonas llamarensis TaxID=2945104 RepID=A0ABT0SMX3_9GAMM|nr:hypothetical protein [Halomonas llamarensis]MCL7929148.1 hypothetical protein [Halomonas llamarensis]
MDEELQAIQADLDNVLERLAKHMNSKSECSQISVREKVDLEDAAAVVLLYSNKEKISKSLNSLIEIFLVHKEEQASKKANFIEVHGNRLGTLLACFDALSNTLIVPSHNELKLLSVMANDFMEGRSKWVGQSLGLPLTRPRKTKENEPAKPPLVTDGYVDNKYTWKMIGAMDVYYAQEQNKTPIDDGLFELIAKRWNIKPGTLKDFYYNDDGVKKYKDFKELAKGIRSSE